MRPVKDEEERLRQMADAAFEQSMAGVALNIAQPGGAAAELDRSWQALLSLITMDSALHEEQERNKSPRVKQIRIPAGGQSPQRAQTARARRRTDAAVGAPGPPPDANWWAPPKPPPPKRPISEGVTTMYHALDAHTELRLCPFDDATGSSGRGSQTMQHAAAPRTSRPQTAPRAFGRPAAAQAALDSLAVGKSGGAAISVALSSPRPVGGSPRMRPATAQAGCATCGTTGGSKGSGVGGVRTVVQPKMGAAKMVPTQADRSLHRWVLAQPTGHSASAASHGSAPGAPGNCRAATAPIAMRISSFQLAQPPAPVIQRAPESHSRTVAAPCTEPASSTGGWSLNSQELQPPLLPQQPQRAADVKFGSGSGADFALEATHDPPPLHTANDFPLRTSRVSSSTHPKPSVAVSLQPRGDAVLPPPPPGPPPSGPPPTLVPAAEPPRPRPRRGKWSL